MPEGSNRFEDNLDVINQEIERRRSSWRLKAVAWMDFDDVAQMILTHIYTKWEQWDAKKPLRPWLYRLISNQLKNILRNNYGSFARPCLNCPFNQGSAGSTDPTKSELCTYTKSGLQCDECPVYRKWQRTKKSASDIKLPLPMENHSQEVYNLPCDFFNQEDCIERLVDELEKVLTPKQFKVFRMKFIEGKSDDEISKVMGYITSEKNRQAGYRQIKHIQKTIREKTAKILETKDIIPGR
jgi:RNA polymerase sigma factor (sigma-70 family)